MKFIRESIILLVISGLAASQDSVAQGSAMYIDPEGNVGIGTDVPDFLLDVEKDATAPHITIHNLGGIGGATFRMIDDLSGADFKFKATSLGGFKIRDETALQDVLTIEAQSAANHAIYVDSNGNVGIGPTSKTVATALSVNGEVEARDFIVSSSSISWPDYVFHDTYELRPLGEVENFIEQNRHLPGVPSEAEIETGGIQLGEMVSIQMEKIEELTLYLIALQKDNDDLRKRLADLETN
jgi:hypothetical protein